MNDINEPKQQLIDLAVILDRFRRLVPIQREVKEWLRKEYREHTIPPDADALSLLQRRTRQELMKRGPYLVGPNDLVARVVLVVPSEWKNPRVIQFWKHAGFRWNGQALSWLRDTRKPHRGRVYSPEMWLNSIRKRFYDFWPELACDIERSDR